MANNFTVDKDKILHGALRKAGALAKGEVPDENEYQDASEVLESIILDLQNEGVQLWNTATATIDLAVESLPLASTTLDDNTLSVEQMYHTDSNGYDTPILPMTEQEYYDEVEKAQSSTGSMPSRYWFDMKLSTPKIYFHPKANDSTYDITYVKTVALDDLPKPTSNPQIPKRWLRALIYMVADDIADEYFLPVSERVILTRKAEMYKNKAKGSLANKERGDKFVTPLEANL